MFQVAKDPQGKSGSAVLIGAIEEYTASMSFGSVYTSMEMAMGILECRGRRTFGMTEHISGPLRMERLLMT